jgi:hypothetical protein
MDYDYFNLIQKGKEGWDKLPTEIKEMYNENDEYTKDKGYPYNNKYYWVGIFLSMCKEE